MMNSLTDDDLRIPISKIESRLCDQENSDLSIPQTSNYHNKQDEESKHQVEKNIKRQIEEEQTCYFQEQISQAYEKKPVDSVVFLPQISENKEHLKFMARPPNVLYKEPFKPILHTRILKSRPFNLNADKRVAERKKFDKKIEEEMKKQADMKENIIEELKELQYKQFRAYTIHHAKPAPDMTKRFIPKKSDAPLTIPQSPTNHRNVKYN